MDKSSDFIDEITRLQNVFYSNNNKNTFFKTKQKEECAKNICNNLDINQLLENTIFIIQNTNSIYINYQVVKTFAEETNYCLIIDHLINIIQYCINIYGSFEVHVNLNTFTISAAQRYQKFIYMYSQRCMSNDTEFSKKLNKTSLYYVPSVMDNINKLLYPLFDRDVASKIVMHTKTSSDIELKKLFG